MIRLDGTLGEGGGQVLRTALSLSAVTGEPLRIDRIRGGRKRPGLRRQHLTAVKAVAAVTGGRCEGDRLDSETLSFTPSAIRPGSYRFDVGSAGSAMLVLQTVLPPLFFASLSAGGPSEVSVKGGTHNPMAPPFEFIERSFAPVIARLGFPFEASLIRHGFFPAGGGEVLAKVPAVPPPAADDTTPPLDLTDRGRRIGTSATVLTANLPNHIARRERDGLIDWGFVEASAVRLERVEGSPGPGNALWIETVHESGVSLFAAFGQKGKRAETVAREALKAARKHEKADRAAVEPHLADQVVLYMALRRAGRFTTSAKTKHLETNLAVIERFLPVRFTVEEIEGAWEIGCVPA